MSTEDTYESNYQEYLQELDEELPGLNDILSTEKQLALLYRALKRLTKDYEYCREKCETLHREVDVLEEQNNILKNSVFERIVVQNGVLERTTDYEEIQIGMRLSSEMFMRTATAFDRKDLIDYITTSMMNNLMKKLDQIEEENKDRPAWKTIRAKSTQKV